MVNNNKIPVLYHDKQECCGVLRAVRYVRSERLRWKRTQRGISILELMRKNVYAAIVV